MKTPFTGLLAALALTASIAAHAQDRIVPLADVLTIDATVTSEVTPDLAVVTLAIVREGTVVATLTKDVNDTMAAAFAEAKQVPSVIAANGGYSTSPRYDSRGNSNARTGWQVRAEIVLKSKDFAALGTLVGKLSETLQISGSSFEISPEMRIREGSALIDRAAKAFQDKAATGTRAFGYTSYSIREVTLGNADQRGSPRAMMFDGAMAKTASTPMPVEAGRVTLTVTASGSVQMRK